jgi:N-acetyl-beta-hexosaminidase
MGGRHSGARILRGPSRRGAARRQLERGRSATAACRSTWGHFETPATIQKLLDLMAFLKLNRFHFHLTDDEGWRLQIPGLPELTDFGARRGFDVSERTLLHQSMGSANDLGPGDNLAGEPADPTEANLGRPPRYQGFEQATLNYVGKGWATTRRATSSASSGTPRHATAVIPEFDFPAHARAAVQAMERRFERYQPFDVYANATHDRWGNPFTPDPTWERLTEAGKRNILGLEAELWGENGKAPQIREYQAFPKLLGAAERARNRDTPTPRRCRPLSIGSPTRSGRSPFRCCRTFSPSGGPASASTIASRCRAAGSRAASSAPTSAIRG